VLLVRVGRQVPLAQLVLLVRVGRQVRLERVGR